MGGQVRDDLEHVQCKVVHQTDQDDPRTFKLAGNTLEQTTKQGYLGATASPTELEPKAAKHKTKEAVKLAQALRRLGIHCGSLTTATRIRLWETFLLPKAAYAIHLTRSTMELQKEWETLEKTLLIGTTGCYLHRNKHRLLSIAKILILAQRRGIAMTVLEEKSALEVSPT